MHLRWIAAGDFDRGLTVQMIILVILRVGTSCGNDELSAQNIMSHTIILSSMPGGFARLFSLV